MSKPPLTIVTTMSAEIVVGASRRAGHTNRVKVIKSRARRAASVPVSRKTGRRPAYGPVAPVKQPRDPSVRGKPYRVICVSLPVEELEMFDAFARRVQMSRSQLFRQAVKHFEAKVWP